MSKTSDAINEATRRFFAEPAHAEALERMMFGPGGRLGHLEAEAANLAAKAKLSRPGDTLAETIKRGMERPRPLYKMLMTREREAASKSLARDLALLDLQAAPCAEEEAELKGLRGEPLCLVSLPEPEEADRG